MALSATGAPWPAASAALSVPGPIVRTLQLDSSNQAAWWKPVDEVGGSTYVAFDEHVPPTADAPPQTYHRVVIGHALGDGGWETGCVKDPSAPDGCARFVDDCGHNQPTVVVDGDGFVHAFVSMHNAPWHYYRSAEPGSVTDMVDRSREMPHQAGRFTYPVATRTPNGDVYLIIRGTVDGSPSNGRLYRWSNETNTWSSVLTFASQVKHWVYPDDLVADAQGDLHILYEWSYGGARAVRHLGSYLRYSPTTGLLSNLRGDVLQAPVTTAAKAVYQPLEQGETATGGAVNTAAGIQSAKLAIVPGTSTPMIAYRYRRETSGPFEVRRARPYGTGWRREVVYAGRYDTFAAIDITHSGDTVRIYYAKKNHLTRDQAFVAEKGQVGDFAEISVAPGRTVERLAVTMAPDGTDHLYLSDLADAPRDKVDPRRSEDPPCLGGAPGVLLTSTLPR